MRLKRQDHVVLGAQLGRAGLMIQAGLEISPLSLTMQADFTQRANEFLRDRKPLPRTDAAGSALAYGVTVYSHHRKRSFAISFFDASRAGPSHFAGKPLTN